MRYRPAYTQPAVRPSARPDTSRLWRIFALLLSLVILCVGVFAVWIMGTTAYNGIQRAVSQIPTLAPVVVPEATGAPTGVVQAPTPWPTFTPDSLAVEGTQPAAPGPTATLEPDWVKYLTSECAAALSHLRTANKQFTDNPAAPFDPAWRDDLSNAVSEMKAFCGTLESASPVPNLVEESHRSLTLATQEYDTADQLFRDGVKEFNPGKVFESFQHIGKAAKYLGDALGLLDKIGE